MKNIAVRNLVIRLILIWIVVVFFMLFGKSIDGIYDNNTGAIGIFLIILLTIIGAAFGVVKQADVLAHKLGEPYGTLILTLSIVSIEVILIAAMMFGTEENPTIGKDSIFAVMMIIMNLIIGLCILLGGWKHGEQEYNAQGTLTYLSMIIILGGISMMLPNFIHGKGNGEFTTYQAFIISGLVILLYMLFLYFQTKRYKHLYIQPAVGNMEVLFTDRNKKPVSNDSVENKVSRNEIIWRSLILISMILPIVLLSHNLATLVDYGTKVLDVPPLLGGVLIAIIVFTPESIAAIKAAINNEFQRAINLCHGAFVSTVGLTVPAVLIIGLITNKTVLFGLDNTEMFLFVATLILNMLTFSGKKTVPILGVIYITLFVVFITLVFNP